MGVIYLIAIFSLVALTTAELGPKDVPNHPNCPKIAPGPEEFPTFLPHPDECAAYYECDNAGNAIYLICPPDLHWNQQNVTCDWKFNVNCTKPNQIETIEVVEIMEESQGKNFELKPEDIPNHPDCPKIPPGPEEYPTYLVHPTECGSFYECDNGANAIYHNCPPTLHWNRQKITCDWPENAGCE